MKRISMLQLKKELNKHNDTLLENVFISHPYATEDVSDDEFALICCDEDNSETFVKLGACVGLKAFIIGLNKDLIKIAEVMENEEMYEDYQEEECEPY